MEAHRILIIDDHEPTRKALRSILRRKGYEVTEAGTIAGGLALLDLLSPPPVCVVLDMDLPDGRGETVLRAIREGHMPVRVAVCSGMSDPSRWDAVKRLGPEATLRKPIDAEDVCDACDPGRPAL
jgi:DNA-binding NarL/FixJ family response regulator